MGVHGRPLTWCHSWEATQRKHYALSCARKSLKVNINGLTSWCIQPHDGFSEESNGSLFSSLKVETNKLICGSTCKRNQKLSVRGNVTLCKPMHSFLVCKNCQRVNSHFSTARKFITCEKKFPKACLWKSKKKHKCLLQIMLQTTESYSRYCLKRNRFHLNKNEASQKQRNITANIFRSCRIHFLSITCLKFRLHEDNFANA